MKITIDISKIDEFSNISIQNSNNEIIIFLFVTKTQATQVLLSLNKSNYKKIKFTRSKRNLCYIYKIPNRYTLYKTLLNRKLNYIAQLIYN